MLKDRGTDRKGATMTESTDQPLDLTEIRIELNSIAALAIKALRVIDSGSENLSSSLVENVKEMDVSRAHIRLALGMLDDDETLPVVGIAEVAAALGVEELDPWKGHPLTEMYGGADAPRCATCRRPYSRQEAAAGMTTCEHCPPPMRDSEETAGPAGDGWTEPGQ